MSDNFPDYAGRPARPQVDHGQHGTGPFYRLYPTQDGWLFLAAVRETHRKALRQSVPLPESDGEELAAALAAAMLTRTTAEWLNALHEAGVPCANPLVDLATLVMEDPLLVGNGVCTTLAHPRHGKLTSPGALVGFSLTPCRVIEPEPLIGQHTTEVLLAAGVSLDEIAAMERRGVAATARVLVG
ncbi:MAG: CoA transferase [Chloroflexi bacterium]|nr:CoA transferase [Chloroflexota bacterium]